MHAISLANYVITMKKLFMYSWIKTIHVIANPFATDNTLVFMIEHLKLLQTTLCMYYRGNSSSRFSSNSEADASELLENLENRLRY